MNNWGNAATTSFTLPRSLQKVGRKDGGVFFSSEETVQYFSPGSLHYGVFVYQFNVTCVYPNQMSNKFTVNCSELTVAPYYNY